MQTFKDSTTGDIWEFEDDVVATESNGAYSFETARGDVLTRVPATLQPYTRPVPTAAEKLAEAQQTQIAALTTKCRKTIVGGYSSDALGATHTYPSTPTDQANMTASVTASLLPNLPANWSTLFWCADSSGTWAFVAHTVAQIQQAGSDGKTFVQAQQQKLQGLVEQVSSATTVADVQAVTW